MSTERAETPPDGPLLSVEVVWSPQAGAVQRVSLRLPPGATLADALRRSALVPADDEAALAALSVGIWGRVQPLTTPLRERDRVEIYRPLKVDPKEARRQRYRRHRENREGREAPTGKP